MLGLGLRGLSRAEPPAPEAPALPHSFGAALDALDVSATLREVLGDGLADLFVALKRHESAERHATTCPRTGWDFVQLVEQA